ncbi:tigger transposable element-derived protein 1-like [Armigeres subalbatus]|uniref:tigger transposable element-derived protein 1-like n=1 Tax=Armigeres subalbatus TaxID=124917 RepID=UPI002ED377CC
MTPQKEKKQRKSITLETKLDVLKCLSGGQSIAAVSRTFQLHESTVRTIKKNEGLIQKAVMNSAEHHAKRSSYVRDEAMCKMERALLIYVEEKAQKRCPLDQESIMAKALQLYGKLREDEPSASSTVKKQGFVASKGWFYRFIRKHSIRNVRIKGESASADVEAASTYPAEFRKLIEEGAYHPDQVFNADETGLFWKKMPSRTYLAKTEKTAAGFKAAKDRISLLMCSNASGDKILKPLLLHKSMRPRSMKNMNFNQLPVHWMSNAKAWVTKEIFRRWIDECFVPEVQEYLEEKGLEFRVILAIDNAPGHCQIDHPNVKVVFLPPNTTSLIQPLDQGIISTFKRYFIKSSFRYVLDQVDNGKAMNITEAWKSFTMRECVEFIDVALHLLKKSTLNACWKRLWPSCVQSSMPKENEEGEILLLAHAIGGEGFDDFAISDIEEMLKEPFFDDDDLIDFINDSTTVNDEVEEKFIDSKLKEGLQLGENLADFFVTHDPCIERAVSFRNDIKYCLRRYEALVNQEKNEDDEKLVDEDPHPVINPSKRRRCGVIYDSD